MPMSTAEYGVKYEWLEVRSVGGAGACPRCGTPELAPVSHGVSPGER